MNNLIFLSEGFLITIGNLEAAKEKTWIVLTTSNFNTFGG